MSLLELHHVSVRFGGLVAVDDVSLSVEQGEVLSIIGPNGAGKTSLFNVISRIYAPAQGRMVFDGLDFTSLAAHKVAQLGIARTFQNLELFDHATVLENLLVGRHRHRSLSFMADAWFGARMWQQELESRRAVEEIIDFLDLHRSRHMMVGTLPYGTRKLVELGRALACKPRMVLLDEPSSGLNVEESRDIAFWIRDMQRLFGIAVVLVEHDMALVGRVSDRVLALNQGRVIAAGPPQDVQRDPDVVQAYLGRRS